MRQNCINQRFSIGDEWLYFKFYCGPTTAESILEDVVGGIVNNSRFISMVDCWFFVRYADPEPHIRVRFHLTSRKYLGVILMQINKRLKFYIKTNMLWNYQLECYNREIERYGIFTMEFSEMIFWYDSKFYLEVIRHLRGTEGETIRWSLSIKLIDCLLDCFGFSISEKYRIITRLMMLYRSEFNADKLLRQQIGTKYSELKNVIEKCLNPMTEGSSVVKSTLNYFNNYKSSIELIALHIKEVNLLNKKSKKVDELIPSYIHMTMNRMFRSKQRVHELVIYDFLSRYYKSELAKKKINCEY